MSVDHWNWEYQSKGKNSSHHQLSKMSSAHEEQSPLLSGGRDRKAKQRGHQLLIKKAIKRSSKGEIARPSQNSDDNVVGQSFHQELSRMDLISYNEPKLYANKSSCHLLPNRQLF